MSSRPRTPLFSPKEYFEQRDPPLFSGAAVFFLEVIVSVVVLAQLLGEFVDRVTGPHASTESSVSTMQNEMAGPVILESFLILFVVARVMHIVASRAQSANTATDGGERIFSPSYLDALVVTGWAHAPLLLTAPVQYAISIWRFDHTLSEGMSVEEFESAVEGVEFGSTVVMVDFLFTLVIIVWTMAILTKGVSAAYDVRQKPLYVAGAVFAGLWILQLLV